MSTQAKKATPSTTTLQFMITLYVSSDALLSLHRMLAGALFSSLGRAPPSMLVTAMSAIVISALRNCERGKKPAGFATQPELTVSSPRFGRSQLVLRRTDLLPHLHRTFLDPLIQDLSLTCFRRILCIRQNLDCGLLQSFIPVVLDLPSPVAVSLRSRLQHSFLIVQKVFEVCNPLWQGTLGELFFSLDLRARWRWCS